MKRCVKIIFSLLAACLATSASLAADPAPEAYDARAMGLGGAVTSVVGRTMSARANPAALVPERGFLFGATYLTRSNTQLDALAVTLVDNSTSPIAGAIHYLRVVTEGESEEVGLSLAAGERGQFWGMTGRFAHTRADKKDNWRSAFVGDFGLLLIRSSGLHVGLVGRDFLDSTYDALERRVALGLSKTFDSGLMVSADYVRYVDLGINDGYSTHLGVEFRPSQTPWELRGGYTRSPMGGDEYYSGGLGWSNQTISADYAFRINKDKQRDFIHVFSFSAPF